MRAGWAQARLKPRVDHLVEKHLFDLTTRVELPCFDDTEFHDSMHRARDRGLMEAAPVVEATIDILTGLIGLVAAAGALGVLHPVLLPLLLITAIPDGWAAASSMKLSGSPPSAWSRQLSATVRTCSRPSDVVTWPVTVSASIRRTFWSSWSWRVEARFVAIVVLPTPPFGLKIATTVARRVQSPISIEPLWITGPEPSSTVTDRMHIASMRHRIESAV